MQKTPGAECAHFYLAHREGETAVARHRHMVYSRTHTHTHAHRWPDGGEITCGFGPSTRFSRERAMVQHGASTPGFAPWLRPVSRTATAHLAFDKRWPCRHCRRGQCSEGHKARTQAPAPFIRTRRKKAPSAVPVQLARSRGARGGGGDIPWPEMRIARSEWRDGKDCVACA